MSVEISDMGWDRVAEEWRSRGFGSLRRGVEGLGGVPLDDLDELLFGRIPPTDGRLAEVLADAFAASARRDDGPLLVALYVYGRCLEKWETSEDYDRIEDVLRALAEAAAAGIATRGPAGRLAALAVEQAQVITRAMSVEDGLSCSCPVAVGERSQGIVDKLDGLVAQEPARGEGFDGPWAVLKADADTSRRYFAAVAAVAKVIEAFADQAGPGRIPELLPVLDQLEDSLAGDVYESELRAHRAALAALERCVTDPRLRVDDAELVYVYPFALDVEGGGGAAVAGALGGAVVDELAQIGLAASARPLEVNDLWDPQRTVGAAERYSGALVELPELSVETTARMVYPDEIPPIAFTAEIRLSSLGNHYLRVASRMAGDGVHDVNQALRRGSHSMGTESITCVGRPADAGWTTMSAYAEEVHRAVASAFGAELIVHAGAPFHVVLAARAIALVREGGDAVPATRSDLEHAVGSTLLFHPVRHLATALEEWVRYPQPVVENLLGQQAYAGDLVVRTDNTTIGYMPASPEWLVEEYQEMIEFAASLPPLFALWEREVEARAEQVDRGLPGDAGEAIVEREVAELELSILTLEQRIRRELAFLRSPALCRTRGQRRFLDELWSAAGYQVLEAELERWLARLAEREERIAALRRRWEEDRSKRFGEKLGLIGLLLAVTSLAGVFQWLDGTFGSRPPHGHLWAWVEAVVLIATLGLVVAFLLAVRGGFFERRRR